MSLVFDSRQLGPRVSSFCSSGIHGRTTRIPEALIHKEISPLKFHLAAASREDSSSSSSSSIGECSDSVGLNDGDNQEGEVQSRFCNTPLAQLDSLHDALPIKRGLSNFFVGKSKSFECLSDANSIKDLRKQESPLNKRRRILLSCKNSAARRGFSSSLNDISSHALLSPASVQEEEEEESSQPIKSAYEAVDEEEEEEEEEREKSDGCYSPYGGEELSSMPSRKFSLTCSHRI